MYELPENFDWLPPWYPIEDEEYHLKWGQMLPDSGERPVGKSLVKELELEMPKGHVLYGLSLKAVAYCSADPNEFLFVSNDSAKPIACVHLTWKKEKDQTWPYTTVYSSSEEWFIQMKREHEGNEI
jgi:hypothetical protein